MNELLNQFKKEQIRDLDVRNQIITRLLDDGHITPAEAIELLKTIAVNLVADQIQVSTGGKILGGSDLSKK